jgi:hypothetical protein
MYLSLYFLTNKGRNEPSNQITEPDKSIQKVPLDSAMTRVLIIDI